VRGKEIRGEPLDDEGRGKRGEKGKASFLFARTNNIEGGKKKNTKREGSRKTLVTNAGKEGKVL